MAPPRTFVRKPHERPSRPDDIRPHWFDEVWEHGVDRAAPFVVPLECVRPGDRQIGAFTTPERLYGAKPPLALDGLADFPDVESIIGGGPVSLRAPLPSVRELVVSRVDDETLANLPSLERLSFDRAIDDRPLKVGELPRTLLQLGCSANAFGGVKSLPAFTRLWRLATHVLAPEPIEPLSALTSLRWLELSASKGLRRLRHIGEMDRLEVLTLSIESGSLADLSAFGRLQRLRRFEIRGRPLRSLVGIEALGSLISLGLVRTEVQKLDPLEGVLSLRSLTIEGRFDEVQVSRMRERRPDVEVRWTP